VTGLFGEAVLFSAGDSLDGLLFGCCLFLPNLFIVHWFSSLVGLGVQNVLLFFAAIFLGLLSFSVYFLALLI
jgi:hypothetical protein